MDLSNRPKGDAEGATQADAKRNEGRKRLFQAWRLSNGPVGVRKLSVADDEEAEKPKPKAKHDRTALQRFLEDPDQFVFK